MLELGDIRNETTQAPQAPGWTWGFFIGQSDPIQICFDTLNYLE